MDMGGMHMGGDDMSATEGGLSGLYLQKLYWTLVGSAIAAFTLVNAYSQLLCWQRRRSSSGMPAKPQHMLARGIATLTAITRELSNASVSLIATKRLRLRTPTLGRTAIVVANAVALVVLCLCSFNVADRWSFEKIGYRTGMITVCQLPLLFLLAAKRNIVATLIGSSYERINWLHRWAARCMLLTATIHMGYWFADWAPYDYIGTKIREDAITKRGVIAWVILLWITISSMTPIRGWSYEFFVVQHIISFVAFVVMVYFHVPAEAHVWIWICVGLFFFDRVLRCLWYAYYNLSLLHPTQRKSGTMGRLWACQAEVEALSSDTTRITIRNPPMSWKPGQHVFLSIQSHAPLQAHPFTVASLPSDGRMELIVQSRKGATRRLRRHAKQSSDNLPSTQLSTRDCGKLSVAIDGPYGRMRSLQQFDSIILLAGSTGGSFTMPLLRDLVRSWAAPSDGQGSLMQPRNNVAARHIKYVWVVKSGSQLTWFDQQLSEVVEVVNLLRNKSRDVQLDISVYITCDDTFTTSQQGILSTLVGSSNAPRPRFTMHGSLEEISQSLDEKHVLAETVKELGATPSNSSWSSLDDESSMVCGSNNTCCCTASISDEQLDGAGTRPCTCAHLASSESTSSSHRESVMSAVKRPLLHPSIALFAGRPVPHNIIRKTLEQACGESAVVVCGPQGLVSDVRASVVALSDERAVHKGSGAQGIWLHTEAFGY